MSYIAITSDLSYCQVYTLAYYCITWQLYISIYSLTGWLWLYFLLYTVWSMFQVHVRLGESRDCLSLLGYIRLLRTSCRTRSRLLVKKDHVEEAPLRQAWFIVTKLPTGSSPREGGGASSVRDQLLLVLSLPVHSDIHIQVCCVFILSIIEFGEFVCIHWFLCITWRFIICLNTLDLTICNKLINNIGCQLENKVWYVIEFPPPFGSEGKRFILNNLL